MIELTLPWPPSVNAYWRHVSKGKLAGRVLISREGRAYRMAVGYVVLLTRSSGKLAADARLAVEITAHAPDHRQRDLDNLPKAILDSLTHAGVWADDSQVDLLIIRRGPINPQGIVIVQITHAPTCLCLGCSGGESKP